jgi:hypothetical protein
MSTYERSIVSIIEPKIKVDEISVEDQESKEAKDNKSEAVPDGVNTKSSSRYGAYMPVIQINSNKFDSNEILYMSLNIDSKIPTISTTVSDTDGKFDVSFPLDGDVISLYLRPPDTDNQKPIRMDFDILSIDSNAESKIYSFTGIAKIPGIFAEACKSYPSNTSFEHIQDACEELEIGFASNETATDDTMIRIRPFDTLENFIDDAVFTAYKDDDSFFDWYIDPYYYLCMVNLNKQFTLEDKTEEINISTTTPLSGMNQTEDAQESLKGSLVLTNQAEKSGQNIFIENYSLENKTGAIWKRNGYKRYGTWWQLAESESTLEEAFVDPLTTPGAETDFILLKGRVDEKFFETQLKYKWLGKQASVTEGGNVHDNFQFSKILNHQNIEELSKTTLQVDLAGMNFYIYRYMRIPIVIYNGGDSKKQLEMQNRNDALGESNDNPDPEQNEGFNKATSSRPDNPSSEDDSVNDPRNQTKNEFLSGYYVVGGIRYTYSSPGPVKQSLTLIRREWPIPAKNKSQ